MIKTQNLAFNSTCPFLEMECCGLVKKRGRGSPLAIFWSEISHTGTIKWMLDFQRDKYYRRDLQKWGSL